MRNYERGIEELALNLALDIEPHDPPKGMGDRLFAKIESAVAPPAAKSASAAAKAGKLKLTKGIWTKSIAVAVAGILAVYGAYIYDNPQTPFREQNTALNNAANGKGASGGTSVARANKHAQTTSAPTAVVKHEEPAHKTRKDSYNTPRKEAIGAVNGNGSGSEESRGTHITRGEHGNHAIHDSHVNYGEYSKHGNHRKPNNQDKKGDSGKRRNSDNQGNSDNKVAPAPAPNHLVEIGLLGNKNIVHVAVGGIKINIGR